MLVLALVIYDRRRMYKHDLGQMTSRFVQYEILEEILVEHPQRPYGDNTVQNDLCSRTNEWDRTEELNDQC
jgi:hypothetical protein